MKNKKELLITTLVCLLPMLAGAIVYPRLPEQVATHFGFNGQPDGFSGRAFAVFGIPAMLAGINLVLHFGLAADPKRGNMSGALRAVVIWTVPAVSVLVSAMTLGSALGYDMHVSTVMPLLMGVLFLVIGNYLPKTKQSYTMGIRLPWTLHSEENWDRTHRLAGFLWVLGGAACVLLTLLRAWNAWLFAGVLLVMTAVPCVYSYVLYKKGI